MSLIEFGLAPKELSLRESNTREQLAEMGALRQQIADLQARCRSHEARIAILERSRATFARMATWGR